MTAGVAGPGFPVRSAVGRVTADGRWSDPEHAVRCRHAGAAVVSILASVAAVVGLTLLEAPVPDSPVSPPHPSLAPAPTPLPGSTVNP